MFSVCCFKVMASCSTWLFQSCLCLFTLAVVYTSEFHSVAERVVYKYPGQLQADWELPECDRYSVCSVMHRRFWQPPIISRLCRCVQGSECPWKWAQTASDNSMPLDNRSQLKFCERVTDLPKCPEVQSAMVLSERIHNGNTSLTTQTLCQCHWPAYWQLHRKYYKDHNNGSIINDNYYRCAKLTKCNHYDFCGNVLPETFSTYYRCSCPAGTMCLNRDRTLRNATELLYSGPVYRAYCLPVAH